MMRQKKLLGLALLAGLGLMISSTHADGTGSTLTGSTTTGTTITGTVITGTVITGTTTTGTTNGGGLSSGNFQIIIDPITHQIKIVYGSGTTNTGTQQTTGTQPTVIAQPTVSTGNEFGQALSWMFTNGLTRYDNETEYRPNDLLTREEVAKLIGQAYIVLGYAQTVKNQNCTFSDMQEVDPTLSGYVINACKRGLFKGANGKFLPRKTITRPEAMAVLIRMFEGKVSNEGSDPRWGDYYLKGRTLGLTTLNNQNLFNKEISRKEIAIYINRLKNIITDANLKALALAKISAISGAVNNVDTGVLSNFESLANSITVSSDPELQEAIRRMNDNGLTNFTTIAEYKPFEILNREQAAKILYLFGGVFNFVKENTGPLPSECIFKDIDTADASLMSYIENSCKANILKGSNGYFSPKTTINKAQFITAMVRMFEGKKLDETMNPRWTKYFEKAKDMGIVAPADLITFENTITRYEAALFLYRFKVKYQMLQNINSDRIQNEIISTVPGSITTGVNNMKQANVYVDMNLLQNGNFELGYIEVFGTRYKVVRSTTEKYFSNNFVRYGDVFDLDTDNKIGTVSFIVSNGYVIEGAIRLPNHSYQVAQLNDTKAYYQIKQMN